MDKLLHFLSQGDHPVKVILKPKETLDEFISCMERGFLNVLFSDTQGGTEVGIVISQSSLEYGDIDQSTQNISIQGECGLNFNKIKISMELSLTDYTGLAQVRILES